LGLLQGWGGKANRLKITEVVKESKELMVRLKKIKKKRNTKIHKGFKNVTKRGEKKIEICKLEEGPRKPEKQDKGGGGGPLADWGNTRT